MEPWRRTIRELVTDGIAAAAITVKEYLMLYKEETTLKCYRIVLGVNTMRRNDVNDAMRKLVIVSAVNEAT